MQTRFGHILTITVLCLAALLSGVGVSAVDILSDLQGGSLKGVQASADSYEYIANNVIAKGHVVVRYQNMQITCDKVIIDVTSQDIEAVGNVVFTGREEKLEIVDYQTYEDLLKDPASRVVLQRFTTSATGKQRVEVKRIRNTIYLKAERAAGNLKTGTIQFKDFVLKTNDIYSQGEFAERTNDGTIVVTDAKITTCNYLVDDHDHYAIGAGKAVIKPRNYDRGVFNYNTDHGEHSVWVYNALLKLWDIPVFWFPALYKPAYTSSFGGKFRVGHDSDKGYYIQTSKNFQILDEPYLNINTALDYYTDRGFGYGVNGDLITPESSTEFFFYGINDRSGYKYWDNDDNSDTERWKESHSRLEIPKYRYELKLANVTHLSPRMDFRGQIELLSDFNFLNDYFTNRYSDDIQPPTYFSTEYQADRFTGSVYVTPRINDFYTSVERLPELRLDFQRQELFSGIYYQGENSMDWLNMRWRNYDRSSIYPGHVDASDYNTARFDTLHMFYYPFKLFSSINIIPRAGVRMTAYSRTSDRSIDYNDLTSTLSSDTIDGESSVSAVNYDGDGGAQFRVTGEIGVQANTKFYRAWQNVKNAYFELDGMRHVFVPYVNYTYIPQPNVSRDHLFYFDDIDRIDEQNFIRFGGVNRLQTRRNGQIFQWLSLENYWDFHFHREGNFNNIGDLGTIFSFTPFEGLSLTSDLLLDLGQSDDHDVEAWRANRYAGRPGLSWKYIDRWYTTLSYQIAKHWRIYGSYNYSDAYNQRSTYSMGSMLTAINSTSAFETAFARHQTITGGIEFPLLYEYTRLTGRFEANYDFESALMRNISIAAKRNFHCWDLFVELGQEGRRGYDGDKEYSHYISFYISLTAMPGAQLGAKASP